MHLLLLPAPAAAAFAQPACWRIDEALQNVGALADSRQQHGHLCRISTPVRWRTRPLLDAGHRAARSEAAQVLNGGAAAARRPGATAR